MSGDHKITQQLTKYKTIIQPEDNQFLFLEDIYHKYLTTIENINFTPREIDIIACVLHGRNAKGIASFLSDEEKSIGQKAVETHIMNVKRKIAGYSKESIISFVEKSDKQKIVHDYYLSLVIRNEFREEIRKLSLKIKPYEGTIFLVNFETTEEKLLVQFLQKNFQLLLPKASIKIQKNLPEASLRSEKPVGVCILPNLQSKILNNNILSQFVFLTQNTDKTNPLSLKQLDLKEQNNHYYLFFNILYKLFPEFDSKEHYEKFKSRYMNIKGGHVTISFSGDASQKKQNTKLIAASILLFSVLIGLLTFLNIKSTENVQKQDVNIYSDLIIPVKEAFLERPEIIEEMENHLKQKGGIQTIALTGIVGIGGAGKTTLARYYGKFKSDASVVFEINAETKESLMNSFYDLAYLLASTPKLKQDLDFILKIQDRKRQKTQLLNFVTSGLRSKKDWLLIYDNIESFLQIGHFFPHDTAQWGKGKVIITTRNEHIKETSYVTPENIIHINKLGDSEKLNLFLKILCNNNHDQLKHIDHEEVTRFLKNIPPFPLDVSVAAYSIKNMHIDFKEYIEQINEHNEEFEKLRVNLLHEVTDYTKTRYGILATTIEKLNKVNPAFKELFFFICMLDSQNIPRELLENYKNKYVVKDFIYHLRKNGLLLGESYSEFLKKNKVISLHRSTQEIGLAFLLNSYSVAEKGEFVRKAILTIENFYQLHKLNKNTNHILPLIAHLRSLLDAIENSQIPLDTKLKSEQSILFILGDVYFTYTKNWIKARACFDKLIENHKKGFYELSLETHAEILKNLGSTYLIANYLQEGLTYVQESMNLCTKHSCSPFVKGDIARMIGVFFRKTNNFIEAKKYLMQAIDEVSEAKLLSETEKELKAEIYTELRTLYLLKYLNKKGIQSAEEYAIKALELFSKFKPLYHQTKSLPRNIPCVAARYRWKLGEVYLLHHEDYDAAYNQIQEAEYIMNNRCPEDMHLQSRILGLQGEILLGRDNYITAEKKLTESINILSGAFGSGAVWMGNITRAEAKIRLGKFSEGYDDCLHVFNLKHREISCFFYLKYLIAHYHAAFAKYKLSDYQKSFEHFTDFIKNAEIFCKDFLDNKDYVKLQETGVFNIISYQEKTAQDNIKIFLERSLAIFTAIYNDQHPFVKGYIAKNIES